MAFQLDASFSKMIADVIAHFQENYRVELIETTYAFQKGGNLLLVIRK